MAHTKSVKQQLKEYLAEHQPAAITEDVWQDCLRRFAPVSESYLRDLLRATELSFEQPYAGIRQHTLEELEESLREMLTVTPQPWPPEIGIVRATAGGR